MQGCFLPLKAYAPRERTYRAPPGRTPRFAGGVHYAQFAGEDYLHRQGQGAQEPRAELL